MQIDTSNLFQHLQHLLKENSALQAKLDQQIKFADLEEKSLQDLNLKIVMNAALISHLDTQQTEMVNLQNELVEVKAKAAGALNRELELRQALSESKSEHYQLQDLQQQYTSLNIKFEDLEHQLQVANTRIILLQQQNGTSALPESFFENTL